MQGMAFSFFSVEETFPGKRNLTSKIQVGMRTGIEFRR